MNLFSKNSGVIVLDYKINKIAFKNELMRKFELKKNIIKVGEEYEQEQIWKQLQFDKIFLKYKQPP